MQVVENGFGTRVMYGEKGGALAAAAKTREARAFLWSTEWSSLNYLDRCSLKVLSIFPTRSLRVFRFLESSWFFSSML